MQNSLQLQQAANWPPVMHHFMNCSLFDEFVSYRALVPVPRHLDVRAPVRGVPVAVPAPGCAVPEVAAQFSVPGNAVPAFEAGAAAQSLNQDAVPAFAPDIRVPVLAMSAVEAPFVGFHGAPGLSCAVLPVGGDVRER